MATWTGGAEDESHPPGAGGEQALIVVNSAVVEAALHDLPPKGRQVGFEEFRQHFAEESVKDRGPPVVPILARLFRRCVLRRFFFRKNGRRAEPRSSVRSE